MIFKLLRKKTSCDYLAVVFSPSKIVIKSKNKKCYYPTNGIFVNHLNILNLSRLKRIVTLFMYRNKLVEPKTVFALSGLGIEERVARVGPEEDHILWHTTPLSNQKNSSHYFCGISHALVFQYTLLAHYCELELLTITSSTFAQLSLYNKTLLPTDILDLKKELMMIDVADASLRLSERL